MHLKLAKRMFKLGSQKIKTANVPSFPRNAVDPPVPVLRPRPLNQRRLSNPFVGGAGSFEPHPVSGLPFHESENRRRRRHRATPPSPTPKGISDKENVPPADAPVPERRAKSPPLAPRRTEAEQDASMAILLQTGEMARSSRRKKGDGHSRLPIPSSSLFDDSHSGEFTEGSVTVADDIGPYRVHSPVKKTLFHLEPPIVVPHVEIFEPSPMQESLSWLSEVMEQLDAMATPEAVTPVDVPDANVQTTLPSTSGSSDSLSDAVVDFVVDRSSRFSIASPLGIKVAPAATIPAERSAVSTPVPIRNHLVKSVRFMDEVEMRQTFIGASDGKIGAIPPSNGRDSFRSALKVNRRYSAQYVNGQYEPGLDVGDPLLEEHVRQLPRRDAIYWADTQWAGSSSQDVTEDRNPDGKNDGLRMFIANNDRVQLWRSLVPADALPFTPPTSPRGSYLF